VPEFTVTKLELLNFGSHQVEVLPSQPDLYLPPQNPIGYNISDINILCSWLSFRGIIL
jgi:hypothetical protein